MADTRRLNHPPLPPGARKAGWLRLFASLSKHLRLFRSSTLLPARPRTRAREPSRRWDVAQIGGRAGKVRGTNAARVSNDSAAKQPLPAPHGRRGGAATPSSNILNFFSPEPPPPVAAEAATLTIHDFRERDFEMGWLPLSAVTRFFIFFFFSLDSAERDGELTFSFSSFYPWKLIACGNVI